MGSARMWVFEFRFDRRGTTTLWDLAGERGPRLATPGEWSGPGCRREEHDHRMAWIAVAVEVPDTGDPEDDRQDAEDRASRELGERYPGSEIAP